MATLAAAEAAAAATVVAAAAVVVALVVVALVVVNPTPSRTMSRRPTESSKFLLIFSGLIKEATLTLPPFFQLIKVTTLS